MFYILQENQPTTQLIWGASPIYLLNFLNRMLFVTFIVEQIDRLTNKKEKLSVSLQ